MSPMRAGAQSFNVRPSADGGGSRPSPGQAGLFAVLIASCVFAACGDKAPPRAVKTPLQKTSDPVVKRACVRAQRRSRLHVVCPRVLPPGRTSGIQYASRVGGHTGPARSYSMHLTTKSLRRKSDRSQPGHWSVAGATDPKVLRTELGHGRPRPRNVTLDGFSVEEFVMPPYPRGGVHGGHVVFVWQGRGAAYLVSVHDPANRARAVEIATDLVRRTR